MSTVYEEHNSREDWLNARGGHIGASEASAILGYGFMSRMDLWKLKTGRAKPKDLSDNEAVSYGNRAEPALRELFMAKHPELQLFYRPYDFVYQEERPWLRATLDGELLDEDNDLGILEIKTATLMSKADWQKWNGRVPDGYLCQISHQLLATKARYVYLFAELIGANGDSTIREYLFLREDMKDNMEYVLQEEEKFWQFVESDTIPPTPLML